MNIVRGKREPELAVVVDNVPWDYEYAGRTSSVEVKCYRSQDKAIDPNELEIPLFLGYGEDRIAARKVVRAMGALGLPAVGVVVPYDKIPCERSAVEQASIKVPHAISDHYKDSRDLPREETEMDWLGRSQGGAVVLRALKERPEGVGNLALIAPACLDRVPGNMACERELNRQFYRRFALNGIRQFKQTGLDPVNWWSIATIGRQLAYDVKTKRFVPKVGLAMTTSLNEVVLRHVASGHKVVHLVGERDNVFRYADIIAAYRAYEQDDDKWPNILTVRGNSHVASASRKGIAEIALAFEHIGRLPAESVPPGPRPIPPPTEAGFGQQATD